MLLLYSSCFILLFHSVPLEGQTITMYENNQDDNVTNCTFGILRDVDTVVFKAKVDYSQDINIKLVYFQLRKKSEPEYWFIEGIDVHEHCNGTAAAKNISCEHIKNHIVLITIRIIAKREYSVARIRGVIIASNNQQITSDAQNFPQIADSTDINGTLFINGVEVARKNNSYFVLTSGPDVNFKFECESKVSPCLIEILDTGLKNTVKGKSYVSHTFRQQKLNITIRQALCTLDQKAVSSYCIIKTNSNSTSDEGLNNNWYFGFFCVLGFPPIIFGFYLILRKRSCHKLSRAEQKSLRENKDKRETHHIKYSDQRCNDSLLKKDISSTQVPVNDSLLVEDISSTQVAVNDITERKGKIITFEKNKITSKNKGEITKRNETDEDCGKERIPAEEQERNNFFQRVLDVLNSGNISEIMKLELISNSDEVFPLSDQTGKINLQLKNGITFSFKLFAENDTNDKCQCRKCQDSGKPSNKWVQIILRQPDLNDNVSKNWSNLQVRSIMNIHGEPVLKRNTEDNINYEECVTCDKNVIEILQSFLKELLHSWKKVFDERLQTFFE